MSDEWKPYPPGRGLDASMPTDMSDERKPLEMPPWMLTALACSQDWGQSFSPEQAVALYPLIRDYVLDEAERELQLKAGVGQRLYNEAVMHCCEAIRAMKGKP